MLTTPVTSEGLEARTNVRSHLSLTGRVHWDCIDISGRITNLSEWGALIESDQLPRIGAVVRVGRGANAVEGTTAWVDSKRCGVHFKRPISLRDWLSPETSSLQGTTYSSPDDSRQDPLPVSLEARLLRDMILVSRLIDDLGQELMSDQDIADRYSGKLQNLDCAMQMLASACWEVSDRAVC